MSKSVVLSEMAEINPRVRQGVASAPDTVVSFLPMASVLETGVLSDVGERPVGEVLKGYTAFERGDVLLAKITPCMENGKAVHTGDLPHALGFGSTEFHVLRPKNGTDGRYLFHMVWNPHFREAAAKNMTGSAGQKRVPASFLESYKAPFPPLSEQKRIAAILDKADELRAKRRAALAELDQLTQSIFLDMFGDPVTNPKGWKSARLADCTERIQIGPFGSLLHQEDYVVGGVPLVNPMHIKESCIVPDKEQTVTKRKHAELSLYHLNCGDVIMGRRGEMGRCAIVTPEHAGLLCGTGSLFITPKRDVTTTTYLFTVLSNQSMKKRLESFSLGATLPNLNRTIIEELVVPLPALSVQERFADHLTTVKALKGYYLASREQIDVLFASLQNRAFRGEL